MKNLAAWMLMLSLTVFTVGCGDSEKPAETPETPAPAEGEGEHTEAPAEGEAGDQPGTDAEDPDNVEGDTPADGDSK